MHMLAYVELNPFHFWFNLKSFHHDMTPHMFSKYYNTITFQTCIIYGKDKYQKLNSFNIKAEQVIVRLISSIQ